MVDAKDTENSYADEITSLNNTTTPTKKPINWKLIVPAVLFGGVLLGTEAYRYYRDATVPPVEQSIKQSATDEYQDKTSDRINVDQPEEAQIVVRDPVVVEKLVTVEDQAKIDALKKQIEDLRNQKLTPAELQKLIDDAVAQKTALLEQQQADELFAMKQARLLREAKLEAEAEAARIEAEQRKLLEQRRKEAAALLDRQVRSKMLVGSSGGNSGVIGGDPAAYPSGEIPRPSEQSANQAFLANTKSRTYEAVVGQKIPFMSNTIGEGTFIHAALETAIDSSLPGAIRAVVISDVYSMDGRTVLMPKGTRLIGTYNSITSIAQKRALVVWTRALTPDGISVEMAASGADGLGRAGLTGKVNTRFMARFGSAALISVVAAIPTILASESGATNTTTDTLSDVGSDFSGAFSDTISEYLKLPPTIKIKQGDEINVIISQNIVIFG